MKVLLAFILLFVFWGCSGNEEMARPVEGGNPTIATHTVVMHIQDVNGKAAQKAWVQVVVPPQWEQDSTRFLIVDSAYTDSLGKVKIHVPDSILTQIWVRQEETALLVSSAENLQDSIYTLQESPKVYGCIVGEWQPMDTLYFALIPVHAILDSLGCFEVDRVPAGIHSLVYQGRVIKEQKISPIQSIDLGLIYTGAADFLLEDFESADVLTSISPWDALSKWYVNPPAWNAMNMLPQGSGDAEFAGQFVPSLDGFGMALEVWVNPYADTTVQKGSVGVVLGADSIDRSDVDSVQFRIKGPVQLKVRFVTTKSTAAETTLAIGPTWERISIDPNQMILMGNQVTLPDILSAWNRIEWIVLDTSEVTFWLDDIHLWGWPSSQ